MTILYFSTSKEDNKIINKLISYNSSDHHLIICSGYDDYLEAKKFGVETKLSSDYYNSSLAEYHYKKSAEMAQTWFKKIADFSYYQLHLADIVALPLNHYFAEYLRSENIVTNILKKEKPDLVYANPNYVVTPYARWVNENFTLDNMLLLERCKNLGLRKKRLRTPREIFQLSIPSDWILFVRSIANLLALRAEPRPLLFFAQFHQLANSGSLIKDIAKKKIPYYIVGRTKSSNTNYLPYDGFLRPWDFIAKTLVSIRCLYISIIVTKKLHRYSFVIKDKIKYTIQTEYPRITLQLNQSRRVLDMLKPKVIICAASTDVLDQTLVRLAQQQNITTIVPQHGIATRYEQDYYLGDVIPVWGEFSKNVFIKFGQDPNKIVCGGYPLFDKYYHYEPKPAPSKKVILFLSTSVMGTEKLFSRQPLDKIHADFIHAMKRLPKYKAIIRLHPGTPVEPLYNLAKEMGYPLLDHRLYSLGESLSLADYVITLPTTPGLEAIVLKKKAVYYQHLLTYRPEFSFFKMTGPVITDFSNLNEIITKTDWKKYDAGRKLFLQNYFCNLDGKAGERLLDQIV